MRISLKLLAAALSWSTLLPAAAQLNYVDAAQPLIDPIAWWAYPIPNFGTPHPNFGYPSQRIAQTLTVETKGTVVGVFLPIDCMFRAMATGGGIVNIEIRDVVAGLPGPAVLDHALLGAKHFDADGRFTFVPLPRGLMVEPGVQFAIVLENTGGGCEVLRSPSPSGYPFYGYAGGSAFFETSYNPGVWRTFNGTQYADDIPFQLVLR